MIILTGHRGTGKTTVGEYFKKYGFWLFDVGPFWRSVRIDEGMQHIDMGEYFKLRRSQTNNPHWEDDLAASFLIDSYKLGGFMYKDLVISGYRNPISLNYLLSGINTVIFPENKVTTILLECNNYIALERCRRRNNNPNMSMEDLMEQYKMEDDMGQRELAKQATFTIDNSHDYTDLVIKTKTLVTDLGYKPGGENEYRASTPEG